DAGSGVRLRITDTTINNSEKTAVAFTTSGLDADLTSATVTFTDSANHTVTVAASAGTADLSTLADGPISSVLNVTDDAGNTAHANIGRPARRATADVRNAPAPV